MMNSSPDPEYLSYSMKQAGQLPPFDAAFFLWIQKFQLDRAEGLHIKSPKNPINLSDLRNFGKLVQSAIQSVYREKANAHSGKTFDRLQQLFPELGKEQLQGAVIAAVKLDDDCFQEYRRLSEGGMEHFESIDLSIGAARRENPGFLEETYRSARHHLATIMR